MNVKRSFKYKTARAKLRLTKQQDQSYLNGGVNIVVKWKSRKYFWRIFDANMHAQEIRNRFRWQAIKKLDDDATKENHVSIIEKYKVQYNCCFAKVIKVCKTNYILLYFNNKNSMMKVIYDSTTKDELGKGLQIKSQDELLGRDGSFIMRAGKTISLVENQTNTLILPKSIVNTNAEIMSRNLSFSVFKTLPKVVQDFNIHNSTFSKRINDLQQNTKEKANGKVVEININNKRLPDDQPSRDDEDESENEVVKKI